AGVGTEDDLACSGDAPWRRDGGCRGRSRGERYGRGGGRDELPANLHLVPPRVACAEDPRRALRGCCNFLAPSAPLTGGVTVRRPVGGRRERSRARAGNPKAARPARAPPPRRGQGRLPRPPDRRPLAGRATRLGANDAARARFEAPLGARGVAPAEPRP